MEILNLDEMSNVVKQFTYKGETYDICEISLDGFIEMTTAQQVAEAKEAAGETTQKDLILSYRDMIKRMIPTITSETLGTMSMRQLKTLMDFINTAVVDQEIVEAAANDAKK